MVFNLNSNFDSLNNLIAKQRTFQTYPPKTIETIEQPQEYTKEELIEKAAIETIILSTREVTQQMKINTLCLLNKALADKAEENLPKIKEIPVYIQSFIEKIIDKPIKITESLNTILDECNHDQKAKIINALINGLHPDRIIGAPNENQETLLERLIELRKQSKEFRVA